MRWERRQHIFVTLLVLAFAAAGVGGRGHNGRWLQGDALGVDFALLSAGWAVLATRE